MKKSVRKEENRIKDPSSILALVDVLIRRKFLIAGVFIVAVVLAFIYSITTKKVYKLEAFYKITVQSKNSYIGGEEQVLTSAEMIDIIGKIDAERLQSIFPKNISIVKSINILPLKDFKDKFKVVIEVADISKCYDIALEAREYFNNISTVIENGKMGVKLLESVRVFDKPVKPRIKRELAIAGLVGLIAGIFIAFVTEDYRKAF